MIQKVIPNKRNKQKQKTKSIFKLRKSLRKKRYVLRDDLKEDNVGDDLMDKGKEFQSIGPRTEKALFPLDFKRDFGTINNF